MKKYFACWLSICLTGTLFAQTLDMDRFKAMGPRNIGPAGMSGRVTSIDVDLTDSDIIYAGTASGGVWKSENGGINWKPVFDDQPTQSVGAVAVDQRNPDIIWVGTGEGNPRNSQNSGQGIYKSLDGGDTWTCMGLEATKTIHRIFVHPDNSNVVYVGAQGSAWGPNPERGVYRTTDGGKSWEQILYVNESTGLADLVMDPTNPNKMLAAMWEYGRKPWTFNSGGPNSGLYITYDGGDTWKRLTEKDGLPKGDLGRIGLAIAPSNPSIIYALVEAKKNSLYQSKDGGQTWKDVKPKGNFGNRPFYYSDIFVDPHNENRLYSLHSLVTYSIDGGKTWEVLLPYSGVHPDHHAMWIHPEDPSYIIEGNDGGLNISRDRGESWQFVTNIPLAQFYHISYDMDIPYHVAGGMQDNGSWVGPSYVWQSGGIRNAHWQEVFFGDGFDVLFKPDDNRYVYAMSQGGNVGMVDRETGDSKFIKPTHPDPAVELRFHWNAGIAQNPFNPCGLYYGSQFLHYSTDCGTSWNIISPDLTTNDSTKQQQHLSGGLTIDDTEAENHTTILAIAPSTLNQDVIWVGTDDGMLQVTRDGGATWTNTSDRLPGVKAGSWIPFIELSDKNEGEAFVIVNDYRRNDWRPMAFHTTNYGRNWKQIVDETQANGHALSIVQDPIEEHLLFLGTDYGLYISFDKGQNWQQWTQGFPAVSTRDLQIHPREHDLIIGTFGRAAWIMDDIRPLREIARTQGAVLEKPLAMFEAPDAYLAARKSFTGVRFTADGMFVGDNRRTGAMLSLWNNPGSMDEAEEEEESKKSKGKKPKEAQIVVFDSQGDTVRNWSTKLDTGLNRIYWGLDQNGVAFPSRGERRSDDPPGGAPVMPGDYKVVVQLGDHKDSTMVTVLTDPRVDMNVQNMEARAALYAEYESILESATAGFEAIKDGRSTIDRVNESLATLPDSTREKIMEMGKTLVKKLDELEKLYMMPEDTKGIQGDDTNLTSTLRRVRGYFRGNTGGVTQAMERTVAHARNHTEEVLEKVNSFFATDFKDYREMVEGMEYSLFQDFKPIGME